MKKIMVIGCPGSGKSTFSRKLHEMTGIPLFHLDMMYWNPDRTTVDKEVFLERLSNTITKSEWIIDGNYGSTIELRLQACDTVIFLDYPLDVCLNGVAERKGKVRTDMPWIENEEDVEFIEFIKNFNSENRPRIMELLGKYPNKDVHIFKNRRDAEVFLNLMQIPSKIKSWISNKPYTIDDIGMSGNQVLIFEDMVLKIENSSASINQQVQMMQWLEGKVPVPKVLAYEVENGKSYLLMSKVNGVMSCDSYYLEHPQELLEALAIGLKMLWEVDVKDCPVVRDLDGVLKEARIRVENDCVDVEDAEPTTYGEGGFESPEQLLEWLENHRPSFEPVLSHGDFCLPNIFLENGQVKGFIDLGKTGVGDKWNDTALCYRSLKHNFDGTYGGKVYEDFNPDMLFEKLDVEPDWDKINWYLLLDELF